MILEFVVVANDPESARKLIASEAEVVGLRREYVADVGVFEFRGEIAKIGALPGVPELLQYTVTFASGVAASLAANWLYERLKKCRVRDILVRGQRVEVRRVTIEHIVRESIEHRSAEGCEPTDDS